MKNKVKREQVSLLESAKGETQAKEKTVKIAFRSIFIVMLFVIMFCSFLLSFSGHSASNIGDKVCVGTFGAKNYYKTKSCSLVVSTPIEYFSNLAVGDEVLYMSASESGSALFESFDGVLVTLVRENGETLTINKKYVVGKVEKKIPVLGFVFALLQTSVGGVVAMVILFAYTAYLSFSKINYENTEKGKELYALFQKDKREDKIRKNVLRLMKTVPGADEKIAKILSGKFEDNRTNFKEFEKDKFPNLTNKYEFILYRLHEVLIEEKSLSRNERKCVSSLLELLGEIEHINQNIEYMMVDLLLKGGLVDFREKIFESEISNFLAKDISDEDLLNLGSILYILVIKNAKLDRAVVTDILLEYSKKAEEMGKGTQTLAKNISLSIAKTLK